MGSERNPENTNDTLTSTTIHTHMRDGTNTTATPSPLPKYEDESSKQDQDNDPYQLQCFGRSIVLYCMYNAHILEYGKKKEVSDSSVNHLTLLSTDHEVTK
jgi:hypothetical protein